MEAIILILAVVIIFIVSTVVTKNTANKIYILTGYNGFSGLHKLLCASILIILLAVSLIAPDEPELGFWSLAPVAILVLLNLKAKNPAYIVVLSLLQVLYGISWFFFLLLKIFFQFVFHTNINAFSMELKPLKDATLERADWVARKKHYTDANDWVVKTSSYSDASAAYEAGFFTGKLYGTNSDSNTSGTNS